LTVSVDITPPAVAIVSPTNGATRTTKTNVVSGTASDSGTVRSGLSLVQVRVNGGPWQTATGTTNWNRSVILEPCGNIIEARSLDKAGNYSPTASVAVVYVPPNTIPNRPTNVWPGAGTSGISLTPTLQASPFIDSDCIGDTHTASQWQVLNSSGTIVIVSSGTNTVNLTSWTVPPNRLSYGSNYQWRVRYRDNRNGWSSNSIMTGFATAGPYLSLAKQGTNMVLRWPTNTPGFGLQWRTNLTLGNWSNATPLAVVVAGQYTVTNRITGERRFYRLKR
jgi:hypothetical protein